jgi:hypothetical protein
MLGRVCVVSIRDEWINRPAHLMHLSLAEYIAGKENKVTPVPPTVQLKASGGRPRHEPGKMNGLEKKYAAYLDIRKVTGEILDWRFEPLKLKLAPATFYNPDFLLLMPDRTIELHETKGFMEDDAIVKIKVAREMFGSIFTIVLVRLDKSKNWTFK